MQTCTEAMEGQTDPFFVFLICRFPAEEKSIKLCLIAGYFAINILAAPWVCLDGQMGVYQPQPKLDLKL